MLFFSRIVELQTFLCCDVAISKRYHEVVTLNSNPALLEYFAIISKS